nr:LuxR C-terminal-related transcriptional regulator [Kineosporia sp. NBRC 101677]
MSQRRGSGSVRRDRLFRILTHAARVVTVTAAAGSGKTVLVRSWLNESGRADRAAWVSLPEETTGAQSFWLSVTDALRGPEPDVVPPVTAAPAMAGRELVDRLVDHLAALEDDVWLILDDVHLLRSPEALDDLQRLIERAPSRLRLVLLSRYDLDLRLHRFRLAGELTEIRGDNLRFTSEEAAALFEEAGISPSPSAAALIQERTEGWAAGLRLAALSLAGQDDPDRFAADFSGSERNVASYLLDEVLRRQPDDTQRMLLHTSILDQVCGPLADLLGEVEGGEGLLKSLEAVNAFVVSTGTGWFRYHHLFAGLLRDQLRHRESPESVRDLHRRAAHWFADNGHPIEAVRQAQAAEDWSSAAEWLVSSWPALYLNGQSALVNVLLQKFPDLTASPGLAAVAAADQLYLGSPAQAESYLQGAEASGILNALVRMLFARQIGDPPALIEGAGLLQELARTPRLGDDLKTLALIHLGGAELAAGRPEPARLHLELGVAQARRIDRPYLVMGGLANLALHEATRSLTRACAHAREALDLAAQHGWHSDPAVGNAGALIGYLRAWQERPDEAETLLENVFRVLQPDGDPETAMRAYAARGALALAHGRVGEALIALQIAEDFGCRFVVRHTLALQIRMQMLHLRLRSGEFAFVERQLNDLVRFRGYEVYLICLADLQVRQGDQAAAIETLQAVLDGTVEGGDHISRTRAHLLYALAQESESESHAALEQALALAAPDDLVLPFRQYELRSLLEQHQTAHTGLLARLVTPSTSGLRLQRPLTRSELRVLQYLPTHLSMPQIAEALVVSVNTIRTHMKSVYTKLDTHSRDETVAEARRLGLLARI